MQQRLPSLLDRPIAFAHRGASAHAQENTIDAFSLALRLGSTGLETDIWLTADGIPVLDHDGVVGGRLRKRPIANVARTALPVHIPSVDEFFDRLGTTFHLSIDVKDPLAFEAILRHSRLANFTEQRLWLCHPDLEVLCAQSEMTSGGRRVHSTRLAKMTFGPERHAADLQRLGINALNMHHSDWSGGLTTLFHRFGILCFAWDIQFESKMTEILRMGMDAVYSDHVDMMMEVIDHESGSYSGHL